MVCTMAHQASMLCLNAVGLSLSTTPSTNAPPLGRCSGPSWHRVSLCLIIAGLGVVGANQVGPANMLPAPCPNDLGRMSDNDIAAGTAMVVDALQHTVPGAAKVLGPCTQANTAIPAHLPAPVEQLLPLQNSATTGLLRRVAREAFLALKGKGHPHSWSCCLCPHSISCNLHIQLVFQPQAG